MKRLVPILLVVMAAARLYVAPDQAAELRVIPDSVEYAVAARHVATRGAYDITVNGRSYPPRYPPAFSVAILAPIYKIAPGNIGNGIFAIWIASVGAVLLVYLLAERLSNPLGGALAAIWLMRNAEFAHYTRQIMTDVPSAALGLGVAWIFLSSTVQSSARRYALAGCLAALSMGMRPLTGVLVLPFLLRFAIERSLRWRQILALLTPALLAVVGTSWQQLHAFGDWRRTGYQFWLPVPYDYLPLTFSTRYLHDNLALFAWNFRFLPFAAGIFGVILLWRRSADARRLLLFFTLTAIPLSMAHLVYFFTDIRFYFLAISLAVVFAAAGLAAVAGRRLERWMVPIAIILLIALLHPNIPAWREDSNRYKIAMTSDRLLDQDATLITAVDPCYMEELFVHGSGRRVIPIDRNVPYAVALVGYRRIDQLIPPARNAADHACAGLRNGGDSPVYDVVADEEFDRLRNEVANGRPVYLDLLSTPANGQLIQEFQSHFHFAAISPDAPWLVRLSL